MNLDGDKIVPIFKTFDELQADETAIHADLVRDWNSANEAYDAALAKSAVLKKSAPDIDGQKVIAALRDFAKANPAQREICEKMISDIRGIAIGLHTAQVDLAEKQAVFDLKKARCEALERRDGRMFGFSKLARRSQRFASAQLRREGK
jgi:hypothetical protein